MVKIYRYEFDPDLTLHKLKMSRLFTPLMNSEIQLIGIQVTSRLSRYLRSTNDLNHYITTPNHIWVPLCLTYTNPIADHDSRIVYREGIVFKPRREILLEEDNSI